VVRGSCIIGPEKPKTGEDCGASLDNGANGPPGCFYSVPIPVSSTFPAGTAALKGMCKSWVQ